MNHVFVGFGFGPIQSGLFAKEAAESGHFSEIVVAEIDAALVAAIRGNGNRYVLNVACADRIETVTVEGVTLLNPGDVSDRERLRGALTRATEIVTSLPSVAFYGRGGEQSVARQIADGLRGDGEPVVIYTAENNNHAAEILERDVEKEKGGGRFRSVQYLNTVIGKMSQVITDPQEIARRGLVPITPAFPKAFLVEAFNRILVSRITLPGFVPGIEAFEGKNDLLPFEEAKLYGHNAAHTMLGFLGTLAGAGCLSELRERAEWMHLVRRAFIDEAGAALVARHGQLGDPLFTPDGFRAYADDLLMRMTNPYLADTVARATRDPLRKLGRSDRLFGALRLCLDEGCNPVCLAAGALAGLRVLAASEMCPDDGAFAALRDGGKADGATFARMLRVLWGDDSVPEETARVSEWLVQAQDRLPCCR